MRSRRRGLASAALWALAAAALPSTISTVGNAAEGFFTDNPPPAVRAVWPSVYAFVCERRNGSYTATAFLVKRIARGVGADYFFITAGHAVEGCRDAKRTLAADINQPRFERDGITIASQPQRLSDVTAVYVDDAYDLAVVRASAPASTRIGTPIDVGDSCQSALHHTVYAIGFPGVEQRRSLHLARQVKRWSGGEFVGLGRAEFRGTTSIYIAASVDSLPGSSGGPVIDEKGMLIGVIAKGAAAAENGFRYDVDPKNPNDWQTFLVPCQGVLKILQKGGLG